MQTADKDIKNQMEVEAAKLKTRRKAESTTTRLSILGQNQPSLVSATTCEISLSQAKLYLVPW